MFSPLAPGVLSMRPGGWEHTGAHPSCAVSVPAKPLFSVFFRTTCSLHANCPAGPGAEHSRATQPDFLLLLLSATDVVAINIWENRSPASDLEKSSTN